MGSWQLMVNGSKQLWFMVQGEWFMNGWRVEKQS